MTLRPASVFHLLCLGVLRCASILVPRSGRSEWWREWRSELWHVRHACAPEHGISWPAECEVAAFCLGAFQDARCLRAQSTPQPQPRTITMGSASQCLLLLSGIIIASLSIAAILPGVREQLYQFRYRIAPGIVLIRSAHTTQDSAPTISGEQFLLWKQRRQQLFTNFAFYQIEREPATNSPHTQLKINIAHASANLFQLLKLPIPTAPNATDVPTVILSDMLWKKEFAANPSLLGQTVRLGKHTAVVAGIAPAGSWRLPGKVDAWLLEPDAALLSAHNGFVIAEASKSETKGFGSNWRMTAPTPEGTPDDFICLALVDRTHTVNDIFLFAIILACLALPATTSLPLGEYRVGSRKLSWPARLRRWSFLTAKIALLLPVVYLVSIDLAYLRPLLDRDTADYIQLIASFSICLFGLRWSLRDQRQRCPVCLGKLTHPARVGQPSRSFLAWNGTELICIGGHGLLHVPELPTSWFSTQRWLYLDSSWDVLFAETGLAPLYF
jgi:hypothetical protein